MQNCWKLLFAGQFAEFHYLLLFAIWFANLNEPEIPPACRQGMLNFVFDAFLNGFSKLLEAFDRD
jgi:hypothetical protein